MTTFVRTTGGSDLNLTTVIEAVDSDNDLVTLFLSDGEIRHARRDEWLNAIRCNSELVIPAAPSTYLVRHTTDDDAPGIFKEPILGWLLDAYRRPLPITVLGPPDGDLCISTIMTPDGRLQNLVAHYETYDAWYRALIRRAVVPEFEQGLDTRRAYYAADGKLRRGEDLNPFI